MPQNGQNSPEVVSILQHFTSKLGNFTNFKMLFPAVVKDFALFATMKIQFKGEWSIDTCRICLRENEIARNRRSVLKPLQKPQILRKNKAYALGRIQRVSSVSYDTVRFSRHCIVDNVRHLSFYKIAISQFNRI